jgi:hypothetical protein
MAEEEKLSKKEKAFLDYKTKGNDAVSSGQVVFWLINNIEGGLCNLLLHLSSLSNDFIFPVEHCSGILH